MTKKQEDKLTMWTATDAVLTTYDGNWTEIAAFAKAAALFRSIRSEVDPEASKQQRDNKGTTYAKSDSRDILAAQALQMALNIKAYATNRKDVEMEQQFAYTPSHFERMRDNSIPAIALTILNKAKELRKELSDYGVSDQSLETLEKSLEKFRGKNPTPILKKGEKKQATVNIASRMEEGAEQLGIMDDLLGNFNEKYPEFVGAFKNARIVINHSSPRKPGKPNEPLADDKS